MRRADHGILWSRIEREVLSRVEIVGIGTEEAMVAGDVMAHLHARGQIIDVEDVLIGATALVRDLTVVTNNVGHFRRIPRLRVEDWTTSWRSRSPGVTLGLAAAHARVATVARPSRRHQ